MTGVESALQTDAIQFVVGPGKPSLQETRSQPVLPMPGGKDAVRERGQKSKVWS